MLDPKICCKAVPWGIASPVEYDVPKCGEGIMGCSLVNGTWLLVQSDRSVEMLPRIHTIHGTFTGQGRIAAAHFHCHAPTCLSMRLYRCPKGTKAFFPADFCM